MRKLRLRGDSNVSKVTASKCILASPPKLLAMWPSCLPPKCHQLTPWCRDPVNINYLCNSKAEFCFRKDETTQCISHAQYASQSATYPADKSISGGTWSFWRSQTLINESVSHGCLLLCSFLFLCWELTAAIKMNTSSQSFTGLK